MQLFSGFIAKLEDGFSQPLVLKYFDKADKPLQSPNGKLDNSIRNEQHMKLTRSR